MKSLISSVMGALSNEPAVPLVSSGVSIPQRATPTMEHQLDSYTASSDLFAIVNRISNSVSQVNWNLWRKAASGKDEDRVQVTRHAALDLLEEPNRWHPRQLFIESSSQHQELAGECWWIIGRSGRSSLPLNMFTVRPDRMAPVVDARDFIAGYMYFGPKNEKIPLPLDDVIFMKSPHPKDPFRGCGPVQALLYDIDSAKYGAEWNRNFFLNDASPGGIIKLDKVLGDKEWRQFTDRWRSQHQGVANAHRVAVLEHGEWVERAFNMRDMQFVELRNLSREIIRGGFGFPKPLLGDVTDVNRANAEAGEVVFSRWLLTPRLERFKAALNRGLLPLYGPEAATNLEFDYEDPTPPDQAADDASMEAKGRFVTTMVAAGFEAKTTLAVAGLPDIPFERPTPPPAPLPAAPADQGEGGVFDRFRPFELGPGPNGHHHTHAHQGRMRYPLLNAEEEEARDRQLRTVQEDWKLILDGLMGQWRGISAQVRASIYEQIGAAVASGETAALAQIQVPEGVADEGAALLAEAMAQLAAIASQRMVDEAAEQGVNIGPIELDQAQMLDFAKGIALNLGQRLIVAAGREAMRRRTPQSTPDEVVQGVREHLESLSDRNEQDLLGGALTNAQNSARIETLRAAPEAAYFADERLDENTCAYCRDVDGKWLGNSLEEVEALYPNGGYRDCQGRERCRGTVVAVWRPETVSEDAMNQKRRPVYAALTRTSATDKARIQARGRDWFRIVNRVGDPRTGATLAEVYVYDEIGGWGIPASSLVAELSDLDVDEIDLHINSPGGDVYEGIAIYNAFVHHRAKVNGYIDGIAASVASVIAMAADHLTMAAGSRMMIHDAWGLTVGDAREHEKMAELLNTSSDNIAGFYASKAGGTIRQWRAAMLEETWYDAAGAVEAGLADAVEKRQPPAEQPGNRWDLSVFNWIRHPERAQASTATVTPPVEHPPAPAAPPPTDPPPAEPEPAAVEDPEDTEIAAQIAALIEQQPPSAISVEAQMAEAVAALEPGMVGGILAHEVNNRPAIHINPATPEATVADMLDGLPNLIQGAFTS